MKVLVTGATGAVGPHLVRRLSETGHSVRALVRSSSDISKLNLNDVELARGELQDANSVEQAMRGCQHVYNLAAGTTRCAGNSGGYEAVNIGGTENVCRAALRAGIERLVHISTAGNFHITRRDAIDESEPPSPNNRYRKTKLASEGVVLSHVRSQGLPAVIARISSVYGPGLTNWLGLFRAVVSGRFRLIGDGMTRKHMGYISDIVDGLLRCAQTPGISGEAYFLAGSTPVTIKELVETIAATRSITLSRRSVPAWPYRMYYLACGSAFEWFDLELPGAHRYSIFLEDQALDLSKAKNQLGYQPAVSITEGVRQTMEWYRTNGYV